MKLDYSLYTDKERAQYVNDILPLLRPSEYEAAANYILYGKNPETLQNSIQHKSILQPLRKHASYAKKHDESLDALLENPLFDENNAHDLQEKNCYTKPKRTIERPKYDKNGVLLSPGDSVIPGMSELWSSIDRLARQLDIYNGKIQPETEEEISILSLDSSAIYKIKHWLIELRKQQYQLKESFYPSIPPHHAFPHNEPINWFSDSGYWRNATKQEAKQKLSCSPLHWESTELFHPNLEEHQKLCRGFATGKGSSRSEGGDCMVDPPTKKHISSYRYQPDLTYHSPILFYEGGDRMGSPYYSSRGELLWWKYWCNPDADLYFRQNCAGGPLQIWHTVRAHTIDLTNPEHIYQLFEHYDSLKKSSWDDLNGQMKYILMALDDLQDLAGFSDIQWHIIDRKVLKYTNERIQAELQELFGVNYNSNYISTIYRHIICEKVAAAARLQIAEFEAKNDPNSWKICSCCKRLLLKHEQNFYRKSSSKDGWAARCKECDKKIRKQQEVN